MTEQELIDRVKRLERLNEIVRGFDPLIRADAFKMLAPYAAAANAAQIANMDARAELAGTEDNCPDNATLDTFFSKRGAGKPAENVMLICAYLYSEYGTSPITAADINEIAKRVGLILPTRADMTMAQARRDGKALFRSEGEGKYRCTVYGESFLTENFNVTKGRKAKPSEVQ